MSAPTNCRTAPVRGVAVGALTATLALAAHSTAAAPPGGAAIAQVLVLATALGALTAVTSRTDRLWPLLGMLAAGQVLSHHLLGIGGHAHSATHPTTMTAAHLAAVMAGAALIVIGERLGAALSQTVRTLTRPAVVPAPNAPQAYRPEGQPRQSIFLMDASISHRGPPVTA